MRGYDRDYVDGLIQRATDALATDRATNRSAAASHLAAATIPTVWRGYERGQVDAYLRRLSGPTGRSARREQPGLSRAKRPIMAQRTPGRRSRPKPGWRGSGTGRTGV